MSSPVLHFEIGGENLKEQIGFYSSVFGWNIFPLDEELYIADPQSDMGIEGHLFETTKEMNFRNLVLIYVQVDDIHGCLDKVKDLGGEIVITPQEIPGSSSHYALFNDPNGNSIGLLQRRL